MLTLLVKTHWLVHFVRGTLSNNKQSMTDRNKFLNFISPINILFQLFGISPRIVRSKYQDIPHLLFQLSIIAALTLIPYCNPDSIRLPHDFTNQIVLRAILISHAISIFEAIVTRMRQLKIVNQLCRIDQIIGEKFCGDFDNYDEMKKRYVLKIWGVFVGITCFEILGCSLYYDQASVGLVVLIYGHLGITMRLLQNAFYVDMVYERLCIIHKELNRLKDDHCCNVQNQLNLTRDIYGKLWLMTNDINFTFGWSLMAISLECIIDLVSDAHIMYLNSGDTYSLTITIGKFKRLRPSYPDLTL